jgi:hypothetical protein
MPLYKWVRVGLAKQKSLMMRLLIVTVYSSVIKLGRVYTNVQ